MRTIEGVPNASRIEPAAAGGRVLVSVIVAVYNPGHSIDALLESLDAQTLPSESYEVILVDDDSTDGTLARLREWAESRPHATVLHNTPNSGWPGRPRNLGIDAARGTYVFFADHDDRLDPDGLRRMVGYAEEVGADVVVAKEAGVGPGREVPPELFRRNVADARLGHSPILRLLTPHKLFRTAMVREHGIRFPEGRVRLEDHAFVVASYFAAERIAIYADHVCYYWVRREDGESATYHRSEPSVYYSSVARVLAIVEANTEAGELRDRLYAQWYKAKMLRMLSGDDLRWRTWSYQRELLRQIRVVVDRFGLGEGQRPWLGAVARARDTLVREGTLSQLRRLGAVERGVAARVGAASARLQKDGRIRVEVAAHLVDRWGRELRLTTVEGRDFWVLPALARTRRLRRVDVTDLGRGVRVDVIATDASSRGRSVLTADGREVSPTGIGASTTVTLDPAAWPAEDGAAVELRARVLAHGWLAEAAVPASAADAALRADLPISAADDGAIQLGGVGTLRAASVRSGNAWSIVSAARTAALAVARPLVRFARLASRMVR